MIRNAHLRTIRFLLLLAAAAACFSAPAMADDEMEFVPANTILSGDDAPEKILIYSKTQCLSTLRPIYEPEAIIAKGLGVLNDPAGLMAANDCLQEIAVNYPSLIPPQPEPNREPPTPKEILGKSNEYEKARKAINCANPFATGTEKSEEWLVGYGQKSCGGKITDPKILPELQARAKVLERELAIFEAEQQINSNLTGLKDLFVPVEVNPEIDVLAAKAKCYSPSAPLPPSCEGKRISKEELAALSLKINKLLGEDYAKQMIGENDRSAWARLLNDRAVIDQYLDVNKVKALNQQLACLKIGDSSPLPGYREFCEGKGYPTKGKTGSLAGPALELVPNPAAVIHAYRKDEPKRELARRAREWEKQAANDQRYALRRLLAQQTAFQRRKPAGSLGDFCTENERQQRAELALVQKTKQSILPFRSKGQWAWVAKYGLSESAYTAVKVYTGSYYREINAKIWKSKQGDTPLDEQSQIYIDTLNRALEMAPPYQGKPLRRFSALPPSQLAAHQAGSIVTYDAFTSTSKRDDWTWDPGVDVNHSFVIYAGKNGTDVTDLSGNPAEQEVLFKAGTRFKVLSREPRKGASPGSFDFVMAEVDEAGNVIADLPKGGADAPK